MAEKNQNVVAGVNPAGVSRGNPATESPDVKKVVIREGEFEAEIESTPESLIKTRSLCDFMTLSDWCDKWIEMFVHAVKTHEASELVPLIEKTIRLNSGNLETLYNCLCGDIPFFLGVDIFTSWRIYDDIAKIVRKHFDARRFAMWLKTLDDARLYAVANTLFRIDPSC